MVQNSELFLTHAKKDSENSGAFRRQSSSVQKFYTFGEKTMRYTSQTTKETLNKWCHTNVHLVL